MMTSTAATSTSLCIKAITKLFLVLITLPCTLTYFYLRYQIHSNELCFISISYDNNPSTSSIDIRRRSGDNNLLLDLPTNNNHSYMNEQNDKIKSSLRTNINTKDHSFPTTTVSTSSQPIHNQSLESYDNNNNDYYLMISNLLQGIYKPNQPIDPKILKKKNSEIIFYKILPKLKNNNNSRPQIIMNTNYNNNHHHDWIVASTSSSGYMFGYPSLTYIASNIFMATKYTIDESLTTTSSSLLLYYNKSKQTWCFRHPLLTTRLKSHNVDIACIIISTLDHNGNLLPRTGTYDLQIIDINDYYTNNDSQNGIINQSTISKHSSSQTTMFDSASTSTTISITNNNQNKMSIELSCPFSKKIQINNDNNPDDKEDNSEEEKQQSFFSSWFPNLTKDIKRNPYKKNKSQKSASKKKLFMFITTYPTTFLLMSLNIILSLIYYGNKTNPTVVSKQYQKIVHHHEIWRCFTGATAHFEILHLGFNMMTLYSLGRDLENVVYNSISFLFYNITLIIWTSSLWVLLQKSRIYYISSRRQEMFRSSTNSVNNTQEDQQRQTIIDTIRQSNTVGYSGVLFAWIVVQTLERKKTCPIPFLPDVCFQTHTLFQFPNYFTVVGEKSSSFTAVKFNLGPWVQLLVAQIIIPKVSFMGHLSGIICGFMLHWNIIPFSDIVWSPQTLIPLVLLLHWWLVRRILPIHKLDHVLPYIPFMRRDVSEEALDNGSLRFSTLSSSLSAGKEKQRNRIRMILKVAKISTVSLCLVSALFYSLLESLFACRFFGMIMVYFAIQAYEEYMRNSTSLGDYRDEDNISARCGILFRGLFVTYSIMTVTDSMVLGGWLCTGTIMIKALGRSLIADGSNLPFWYAFVILQTLQNIFILILSSFVLYDLSEIEGGIFQHLFGWILVSCKNVGDHMLYLWSKYAFIAFEGNGVTLGTRAVQIT